MIDRYKIALLHLANQLTHFYRYNLLTITPPEQKEHSGSFIIIFRVHLCLFFCERGDNLPVSCLQSKPFSKIFVIFFTTILLHIICNYIPSITSAPKIAHALHSYYCDNWDMPSIVEAAKQMPKIC